MTSDERAKPVRVLIADDDPRVRAALRSFLSASAGFDVIADTGTTTAALELARTQRATLAIIGFQPSDAPAALDLLRAITGELQIPAVAMSMRGVLRSGALAAGAHAFLEKDISPELLLAVLRETALRSNSPSRAG